MTSHHIYIIAWSVCGQRRWVYHLETNGRMRMTLEGSPSERQDFSSGQRLRRTSSTVMIQGNAWISCSWEESLRGLRTLWMSCIGQPWNRQGIGTMKTSWQILNPLWVWYWLPNILFQALPSTSYSALGGRVLIQSHILVAFSNKHRRCVRCTLPWRISLPHGHDVARTSGSSPRTREGHLSPRPG